MASASVVVPAHNERGVIGRCLSALLTGATPGEFDVVVVVNGSTDGTAEVAGRWVRGSGQRVRVLEIGEASKIAALRAGDLAAGPVYPRIYLDADIELDTGAARALARALDRPEPLVAAPAMTVDTSRSSAVVAAYYRVWTQLPYVRQGMVGSGVFGVSRAAAARIGEFPDVVNDDGYVRSKFSPAERLTTDGCFSVSAPTSVRALVRRRARIAVGNNELGVRHVAPAGNQGSDLVALVRSGVVGWTDALVFAGLSVAAKLLARWREATGRARVWSTDTTSRPDIAA